MTGESEMLDRMQQCEERLQVLIEQLEQLTKVIETKNKYIKHLEETLDERLRVV